MVDVVHRKLTGTESQRTPDQVSCETELLATQDFVGVRETWVLLEISGNGYLARKISGGFPTQQNGIDEIFI